MKFSIKDSIPFAPEQVFRAQRDHLPELAPYLHDIKAITVEHREDEGAISRLVNTWEAKGGDIPAAAKAFIKPDMLKWTDTATWDQDAWQCSWVIVLGFLPGAIECTGTTSFAGSGDRTTVTIAGDITIHGDKIPGIPRFMAGKISGTVEKFVIGMIKPNLKKTNEGVTAYLRDQEG